jgi:hypothetical protein
MVIEMFKMFKYVYDIFGWQYRECKFLNAKFLVDTHYYDLSEPVKNKYGEFLTPINESVIHDKHILISYYEIDNATALSLYKLEIKNKDSSGTEYIQDLTTNQPLLSEPSKHEKEKVIEYTDTKLGALPLLNCKLNPYFFEAQMNVKSMKEMKKASGGVLGNMSIGNMLFYGIIGFIIILVLYAIYTGAIHL